MRQRPGWKGCRDPEQWQQKQTQQATNHAKPTPQQPSAHHHFRETEDSTYTAKNLVLFFLWYWQSACLHILKLTINFNISQQRIVSLVTRQPAPGAMCLKDLVKLCTAIIPKMLKYCSCFMVYFITALTKKKKKKKKKIEDSTGT